MPENTNQNTPVQRQAAEQVTQNTSSGQYTAVGARISVARPDSGDAHVAITHGAKIDLQFALGQGVTASKLGQNFVFTFENGQKIHLTGFYDHFSDVLPPPLIVVQGRQITAKDFLHSLEDPEVLPDSSPPSPWADLDDNHSSGDSSHLHGHVVGISGLDGLTDGLASLEHQSGGLFWGRESGGLVEGLGVGSLSALDSSNDATPGPNIYDPDRPDPGPDPNPGPGPSPDPGPDPNPGPGPSPDPGPGPGPDNYSGVVIHIPVLSEVNESASLDDPYRQAHNTLTFVLYLREGDDESSALKPASADIYMSLTLKGLEATVGTDGALGYTDPTDVYWPTNVQWTAILADGSRVSVAVRIEDGTAYFTIPQGAVSLEYQVGIADDLRETSEARERFAIEANLLGEADQPDGESRFAGRSVGESSATNPVTIVDDPRGGELNPALFDGPFVELSQNNQVFGWDRAGNALLLTDAVQESVDSGPSYANYSVQLTDPAGSGSLFSDTVESVSVRLGLTLGTASSLDLNTNYLQYQDAAGNWQNLNFSYINGQFTFSITVPAGQSTANFRLLITDDIVGSVNDPDHEGPETFSIKIVGLEGNEARAAAGQTEVTTTILDDTDPRLDNPNTPQDERDALLDGPIIGLVSVGGVDTIAQDTGVVTYELTLTDPANGALNPFARPLAEAMTVTVSLKLGAGVSYGDEIPDFELTGFGQYVDQSSISFDSVNRTLVFELDLPAGFDPTLPVFMEGTRFTIRMLADNLAERLEEMIYLSVETDGLNESQVWPAGDWGGSPILTILPDETDPYQEVVIHCPVIDVTESATQDGPYEQAHNIVNFSLFLRQTDDPNSQLEPAQENIRMSMTLQDRGAALGTEASLGYADSTDVYWPSTGTWVALMSDGTLKEVTFNIDPANPQIVNFSIPQGAVELRYQVGIADDLREISELNEAFRIEVKLESAPPEAGARFAGQAAGNPGTVTADITIIDDDRGGQLNPASFDGPFVVLSGSTADISESPAGGAYGNEAHYKISLYDPTGSGALFGSAQEEITVSLKIGSAMTGKDTFTLNDLDFSSLVLDPPIAGANLNYLGNGEFTITIPAGVSEIAFKLAANDDLFGGTNANRPAGSPLGEYTENDQAIETFKIEITGIAGNEARVVGDSKGETESGPVVVNLHDDYLDGSGVYADGAFGGAFDGPTLGVKFSHPVNPLTGGKIQEGSTGSDNLKIELTCDTTNNLTEELSVVLQVAGTARHGELMESTTDPSLSEAISGDYQFQIFAVSGQMQAITKSSDGKYKATINSDGPGKGATFEFDPSTGLITLTLPKGVNPGDVQIVTKIHNDSYSEPGDKIVISVLDVEGNEARFDTASAELQIIDDMTGPVASLYCTRTVNEGVTVYFDLNLSKLPVEDMTFWVQFRPSGTSHVDSKVLTDIGELKGTADYALLKASFESMGYTGVEIYPASDGTYYEVKFTAAKTLWKVDDDIGHEGGYKIDLPVGTLYDTELEGVESLQAKLVKVEGSEANINIGTARETTANIKDSSAVNLLWIEGSAEMHEDPAPGNIAAYTLHVEAPYFEGTGRPYDNLVDETFIFNVTIYDQPATNPNGATFGSDFTWKAVYDLVKESYPSELDDLLTDPDYLANKLKDAAFKTQLKARLEDAFAEGVGTHVSITEISDDGKTLTIEVEKDADYNKISAGIKVETIALNDAINEYAEYYSLKIESPSAKGMASVDKDRAEAYTLIIDDDPLPVLSVAPVNYVTSAEEGDYAQFKVSLSAAADGDIKLPLSWGGVSAGQIEAPEYWDGSNWLPLPNDSGNYYVIIPAGETEMRVDFKILDNSLKEDPEKLSLYLGTPEGGQVTVSSSEAVEVDFTSSIKSQDATSLEYELDIADSFPSAGQIRISLEGLKVYELKAVTLDGNPATFFQDGDYVVVTGGFLAGVSLDRILNLEFSDDLSNARIAELKTGIDIHDVEALTYKSTQIEIVDETVGDTANIALSGSSVNEGSDCELNFSGSSLPADTPVLMDNLVAEFTIKIPDADLVKLGQAALSLGADKAKLEMLTPDDDGNTRFKVTFFAGTTEQEIKDAKLIIPTEDNSLAEQGSFTIFVDNVYQAPEVSGDPLQHEYEKAPSGAGGSLEVDVLNGDQTTWSGPELRIAGPYTDADCSGDTALIVAESGTAYFKLFDAADLLAQAGAEAGPIEITLQISDPALVSGITGAEKVDGYNDRYSLTLPGGTATAIIGVAFLDNASQDGDRDFGIEVVKVEQSYFETVNIDNAKAEATVVDDGLGFYLSVNSASSSQEGLEFTLHGSLLGAVSLTDPVTVTIKTTGDVTNLDELNALSYLDSAVWNAADKTLEITYAANPILTEFPDLTIDIKSYTVKPKQYGNISANIESIDTQGTFEGIYADQDPVTGLYYRPGNSLSVPSIYGTYDYSTRAEDLYIQLQGSTSSRTVKSGSGDDYIEGGGGMDIIYGGAGKDLIYGLAGNDTIDGEDGDDLIWGGDGMDGISGGAGNDQIWGGAGNDSIHGNDGDDILYGDAGEDVIHGDAGNDTIYGGAGNDKIYGGMGNDILWGDGGADDFVWNYDSLGSMSSPCHDVVMDFEMEDGDRIDLSSLLVNNAYAPENNKLYVGVSHEDGNTLLQIGRSMSLVQQTIEIKDVELSMEDSAALGEWLRYDSAEQLDTFFAYFLMLNQGG